MGTQYLLERSVRVAAARAAVPDSIRWACICWTGSSGSNGDSTSAELSTVSEAELDAAMYAMDDDGSGTVTFKEFFRWWRRQLEREEEASSCWALTDVNALPDGMKEDVSSAKDRADASPGASPVVRDAARGVSRVATEAQIAMDELSISSEQYTRGTRAQKKGRKVRRMSVVALAEEEIAQDSAAWAVSSAVAGGKTDEARMTQKAVKKRIKKAQRVRNRNWTCCAKSERRNRHPKAKHIDPRMKCRKLFDEIDSDGSGLLDIKEIPKLAGKLGIRLTPEKQQAAMQEMDADGSGEVDFEEFWQWWIRTGGLDAAGVNKHQDTALGKATTAWAAQTNLRSSVAQQQRRTKELKHIAHRPGMSVDDMTKISAGAKEVHASSVWTKTDKRSGVTMWGRKSTGAVGSLGNWETAIETRRQQWQTMSLWMHESDHAFVE